MIGARLVTARLGYNRYSEGTTIVGASELVGVHPKMVERSKAILEKSKLAADAIADGRLSLNSADMFIQLAEADQCRIVATCDDKKSFKREVQEARRDHRQKNPPIVPAGRYSVIVSDPPWEVDKTPYSTMSLDEIDKFHRLLLAEKAADSCYLFLWTTAAFLPSAGELVASWGWTYLFPMTWHKDRGPQHPNRPQYNGEFIIEVVKTDARSVCTSNLLRYDHSHVQEPA
ncbi:hypothetical protein HAP48_0001415 (plasmid) [Bradyrhizobium septentrionale]|uniref:Methyltransferase n=1 Tax=Bradyrhizobium septentrionale TaxID=1404411 RepID=A0A973WB95_9BRAD|nr:MT-A70 family methyltransferase [Bradyrhizobium septentrionale]UGY11802.1 hypothetical protein HAP48_0001415 [Bradyrhizobium septentrionale]UGY30016.1 hypothetical protein HU675_0048805 [Bradyrhizobium septentrionale]